MKKLSKFLFPSFLNSSMLVPLIPKGIRLYSVNRDHNIKPVAVYCNCEQEKARILLENKGVAAVYRLINNTNNKTYIGSTLAKANFSTSSNLYKANIDDKPKVVQEIKSTPVKPMITYPNALDCKQSILRDNKNKSGVYRWVNKINGNTYVGSAADFRNRLKNYFNLNAVLRDLTIGRSRILNAILKYGYDNFQVEILEYCSREDTIKREQYYIDILKPEYNLNPTAGSRLGSKHIEETLLKMSASANGRKHTEATKNLISQALKGIGNGNFGKILGEETKAKIREARVGKSFLTEEAKSKLSKDSGTALKVVDLLTKEGFEFTSIKKAAEFMGVSQPAVSTRLKTQDSFIIKKRYQVNK